ncbi:MAG: MarR family transcriptional regulator [Thermoleophilia bacterium]|nr:MarR family transcriptional regulator [Thermoleophilia bacterium]
MQDPDPVERARRQWAERYADQSGFVVLVSMLRSYALMVGELERVLRPLQLTLSRFEVLLLLSFTRDQRLPVMKLRDLLLIHGSSATYLVDRLAEAGWVSREPDPGDRRVSLVALTDEGRAVVEAGVSALLDAGFGTIGALDEDRRRGLSDLLAALRGSAPPDLPR